MRDLIVTGIPRGGTTLLAALIDSSPSAHCLSEPNWPVEACEGAVDAAGFIRELEAGFARTRALLRAGESVVDIRGPDGQRVTNYLSDRGQGARSVAFRETPSTRAPKPFDVLAVKHNALFLSILPELAASAFETVALVRHPREVFASWLSVPYPVREARLPAGEKFWPRLREIGMSTAPLPTRMALLYEELIARITGAKLTTLLRYEDVLRDGASLFARLGLAPGDMGLIKTQAPSVGDELERTLDALRTLKGAACEHYSF